MGPYEAQLDEEYERREALEQAIEALHDAIAEFWEEEGHGDSWDTEAPWAEATH